jgi:predicted outer membrane repeat protein
MVMSTLIVTSDLDPATPTAGTLRYAINQANLDGAHGIGDTIEFQNNLNDAHFLLQEGPLELNSGASVSIWSQDSAGGELQITLAGDGAGIFHVDQGATLDLNELTLAGGDANASTGGNGGAINNAGTLSANLCNFVDNTATGLGGAIYNTGTLTGTYGTTFTGNSAELGGGVANAAGGKVSLYANFSSNTASGYNGGAIYNLGDLSVAGTIDDNTAEYNGGAIYNDGLMTVSSSTLIGNTVRSTQQGNGGAIYNDQQGTMTVSASTLADNRAPAAGAINNGGKLTLTASTVSDNSAMYGGGLATQSSVTLVDSIVAGDTLTSSIGKYPDVYGSVTASSAYNLIGNGTGLTGISNGANHNQIGTSGAPINPRLDAPASNGGSGETMAPQAGSPVIKAGGYVTTLTSAISAQATVIPVADAAAVASSAWPTMIEIDDEFLEVTNVNLANNTLTVIRDAAPIPEQVDTSHNAGAAVYLAWGSAYGALVTDPDIGAYQPPAGPVTSFSVTGPSAAGVVAGSAFNVTITAEDANGDPELTGAWPVTLTSLDGQTVHASPITLEDGTATVSVVLDKADSTSLKASDGSISATSSSFTVYGAAPVSFKVSAPSTVIAGAGFSLTVTGLDEYGNIATKYGGTATITASDGQSVSPNTADFNPFGHTQAIVTMTAFLDKVDTLTLTATAGSIKGTSSSITVKPAAAARFSLSAPSTVSAGDGFTLKVTALDVFGNVATGYGGTATITASDGQSVYPSTVSFGSFGETPGDATVTAFLEEPDTLTLKATAGSLTGTSGSISVDAATSTWQGTWSGYVTAPGPGVTAVGGTWVVPTLTGTGYEASSIWVGIDGWFNGTTSQGSTVEQCGVAADIVNGKPVYTPWFEFAGDEANGVDGMYNGQTDLPASAHFTVNAGDTISASVTFVPGGKSRTFEFQMTDTPKGGGQVENWSHAYTMQEVTPQLATAEWIVEAPTYIDSTNGDPVIEPLPNFGHVTFTGAWATDNSTSGPINKQQDLIVTNIWQGNTQLDTTSNPPVLANSLGYNEPASGRQSSSFTVTYDSSGTDHSPNVATAPQSAKVFNAASEGLAALESDEDVLGESGRDPQSKAGRPGASSGGEVRVVSHAGGLFTRSRAFYGLRGTSLSPTSKMLPG